MLPKRISARGVVIHNGKILLIHRKSDGKEYYSFPGGGIEKGETSEEACRREVFEETSIKVKSVNLIYVITHENNTQHDIYVCEYLSGEPKLDPNAPEIQEMKEGLEWYNPEWIPVEILKDIILHPLDLRDRIIKNLIEGFPKEPKKMFIRNR